MGVCRVAPDHTQLPERIRDPETLPKATTPGHSVTATRHHHTRQTQTLCVPDEQEFLACTKGLASIRRQGDKIRQVHFDYAVRGFILASPTVIALASGSTISNTMKLALLLPYLATILPTSAFTRAERPMANALIAFMALTTLGVVRYALNPSGPSLSSFLIPLITLAVVVVWTPLKLWSGSDPSDEVAIRIRCAAFSPILLPIVNVGMWIAGFSAASTGTTFSTPGPNETLASFGLSADRVALPLTPSLNAAGVLGAIALTVSVALLPRSNRLQRAVCCLGVICGAASVLITDTRGAMLGVLLALVMMVVITRRERSGGRAALLLVLIAPLMLLVSQVVGSSLAWLSGTDGRSLQSASSRSMIWSNAIDLLSHPSIEQLFGYGLYGQVSSGLTIQTLYVFEYYLHPLYVTLHNTVLQNGVDFGLVGIAAYCWLVVVGVKTINRHRIVDASNSSNALLAGLIVIVILGSTEAVATLYSMPSLAELVVIYVAGACRPPQLSSRILRSASAPGNDGRRGSTNSRQPTGTSHSALITSIRPTAEAG